MLACTNTCAHEGVEGYLVRVEASVSTGLPQLTFVGLPDTAVREGRERVRSAIRATTPDFPRGRGLVNLSPASRRKAGSGFDLSIAIALLTAAGLSATEQVRGTAFLGELGLDGQVRAVNGALPAALCASRRGLERLVLPRANAEEAALAGGLAVYGVDSLGETLSLLRSGFKAAPVVVDAEALLAERAGTDSDLVDVHGQQSARRALEIAAAGRHHMLMSGPPGAGKTMLARRLPGLLPALSVTEAMEVTAVHSVAGVAGGALVTERPFRSPHHAVSGPGLVGGGGPGIRPGEISLSHRGVLFLDELPEFSPAVLNQLRQPLEEAALTICRAAGSVTFPAGFLLVAAMNPCPCGFKGCTGHECRCSDQQLRRYRNRISGPLLDRIDLHVHVPRISFAEMDPGKNPEDSASVRQRVERVARRRLLRVQNRLPFSRSARELLGKASEAMNLSARSTRSLQAVSSTIADLSDESEVSCAHLSEALQYRPLDDEQL